MNLNHSNLDRPYLIRALTLSIGFIFFGFGLYWLFWGRFLVTTDNAYVSGNAIVVSSQVPGRVHSIFVNDTQFVKEGDVLFQLDDTDYKVALNSAKANLVETYKAVQQAFIRVNEAMALQMVKKTGFLQAKSDLLRRRQLIQNRVISREALQHVELISQRAYAEWQQANQALLSAQTVVSGFTIDTHPLLEKAKDVYLQAYLNWKRTTVRAPFHGIIAKRSVQTGQFVTSGMASMMVVPYEQLWLEANFKETQLNRLRAGQKVKVEIDAYSDVYEGTVQGLGSGTGSAFTLLPAQNATGNWVKVVQRVPVRIAFSPEDLKRRPLQIGLSGYVTVYTRGIQDNQYKLVRAPSVPQYVTTIYARDKNEAQQALRDIFRTLTQAQSDHA